MADLLGAKLKVRRARHQFNALKPQIVAFTEAKDFYAIVHEFDSQSGEGEFIYRIVNENLLPEMWPIQFGEIVHNLRSALDHALFEICGRPNRGRIAFPACISRDGHEGFQTNVLPKLKKYLTDEVIDIIELHQPYRVLEKGLPLEASIIYVLTKLWNWDKHSVLNVAYLQVSGGRLALRTEGIVPLAEQWIRETGVLEDGEVLARYKLAGPITNYGKIHFDSEIAKGIAFSDPSPAGSQIVLDCLEQSGVFTETMINGLATLTSNP